MKFNVFTQMEYVVWAPGTLILSIHALRTPNQTVISEEFSIEPYIKFEELQSAEGENRLIRFEVQEQCTVKVTYNALVDNCVELTNYEHQEITLVSQLPVSVLPYLNPSRYCQSDKLSSHAHNMFGHITNPFEQVVALTNWIHYNVQYLSGFSNAETSAFNTFEERAGVCRDFAHLGIALCRGLTIPARYFTGYAYQLNPPDFHACFEAYIGGKWILFDATRLVPLNGLIKIATGRDAADNAIANIFGNINFTTMQVSCELAENSIEPIYYNEGEHSGLSYL
ncbi:transglutaminase-like domain-containing protein [Mucilaginibacter dorajii]|uniref:Transglutaminase family protein n=1 Tax=Mucilaginibacter dorajii TaxID=692994 RepID=A0ABP7QD32_9SPHI|nr:transglutaminase family protein [Mucilaginibacter dorajii]MCS3733029.1 transglutaminase-like putative cysteine protease [Mucilaginibacter dorajii]